MAFNVLSARFLLPFVLVSCLSAWLYSDFSYVHPVRPSHLGPIYSAKKIPSPKYLELNPKAPFPYGRYLTPAQQLNFESFTSLPLFQLKRWHYHSFSSARYFIGLAVADLSYIANAFFYVVDKKTNEKYEYTQLSPLSLDVESFGSSSVDGCTQWRRGDEFISSCYLTALSQHGFAERLETEDLDIDNDAVEEFNFTSSGYAVDVQLPIRNANGTQKLVGFSALLADDKHGSLSLMYPITPHQPAYTSKMAGMTALISMSFSDSFSHPSEPSHADPVAAFATTDWTYSLPERVTEWYWVSLSCLIPPPPPPPSSPSSPPSTAKAAKPPKPIRLGINLSAKVYDDKNGVGMENAIWIDGTVWDAGAVNITPPASLEDQRHKPWKIESSPSTSKVKIDLIFTPKGSREEHVNAFIVVSEFIQPYGKFKGTVEVDGKIYEVKNAFGVVENHFARW